MRWCHWQQTKMATDVLVGFWLITILVASVIRNSATQIMMLDVYSSVENCDAMCTTAFADSKASCIEVWTMGISEHHSVHSAGWSVILLDYYDNSIRRYCKLSEKYTDSKKRCCHLLFLTELPYFGPQISHFFQNGPFLDSYKSYCVGTQMTPIFHPQHEERDRID